MPGSKARSRHTSTLQSGRQAGGRAGRCSVAGAVAAGGCTAGCFDAAPCASPAARQKTWCCRPGHLPAHPPTKPSTYALTRPASTLPQSNQYTAVRHSTAAVQPHTVLCWPPSPTCRVSFPGFCARSWPKPGQAAAAPAAPPGGRPRRCSTAPARWSPPAHWQSAPPAGAGCRCRGEDGAEERAGRRVVRCVRINDTGRPASKLL